MTMVAVLERLKGYGVPSATYHLDLWFGLDREKDLHEDSFYRHIEHFFTCDKKMADWLNQNTKVKGHYLPAGVYHGEAYMAEQDSMDRDIIFVGSRGYHPEWPYRPQLIDWLKETYGDRFYHYGGDGLGTIRGEALNRLYANSKVVVGDTLCLGFKYPHYWSDRLYETLGRGGFLIMPYVTGMGQFFTGEKHLDYYQFGNFEELKRKIDHYLENDEQREAIRRCGHNLVKEHHTYKQRWDHILQTIFDKGRIKQTRIDPGWIRVPYLGKYDVVLPEHLANWDVFDYWEKERTLHMASKLHQGDLLFDVGAEVGWLSAIYAKMVGPEAMVLVEPTKQFWPNIQQTWQKNFPHTSPHASFAGLLGAEGERDLKWGWPPAAKGEMVEKLAYQYLHEHDDDTPVIALDDLARYHGYPKAITIDVEGAELEVLKGAEKTLRKFRPKVWVSVHPDLMEKNYKQRAQDLHDYMKSLGYNGKHLATDHEEHWYYE